MVYRIYVEKKPGLDQEAQALLNDARSLLGIRGLESVRLFNRYDAEGLSRELFEAAIPTVFSEPQVDLASAEIDTGDARVFAVEYLPGQFDQRADSAAQCIQILSQGERPLIRSAKVYALYGVFSEEELRELRKYVINPGEAREASLEKPETLAVQYDIPTTVETLDGFNQLTREELEAFVEGALPEEGVCVTRTYGDAPQVDGCLFLNTERTLMTGDIVRVRVTGASEYDLIGELAEEEEEDAFL